MVAEFTARKSMQQQVLPSPLDAKVTGCAHGEVIL
jgi:hypothetical protein